MVPFTTESLVNTHGSVLLGRTIVTTYQRTVRNIQRVHRQFASVSSVTGVRFLQRSSNMHSSVTRIHYLRSEAAWDDEKTNSSIGVFLLQLTNRTRHWLRLTIQILISILALFNFAVLIVLLLQCRPLKAYHDHCVKGRCFPKKRSNWGHLWSGW